MKALRLANRLSSLLYDQGWTDGELSVRTGIERSRLNRLKNRHGRPTVGEALAIAAALDVPVHDVFWLETVRRAPGKLPKRPRTRLVERKG